MQPSREAPFFQWLAGRNDVNSLFLQEQGIRVRRTANDLTDNRGGLRQSRECADASSFRREQTSLLGPEQGDVAVDQPGQRHRARLTAFEDGALQVGREEGEPQDLAGPDRALSDKKTRLRAAGERAYP